MILLLGASGYVGSAFCSLFEKKEIPYLAVSRENSENYAADRIYALIKETGATFLINAAGYTGKPNVDACEVEKAECLLGNAVLPGALRNACEVANIPWGHVSSGCIYTGRHTDGRGFMEDDAPNFSFRTNNSSFYSGTKALGEEVLNGANQCYIWRLRIPFDHRDSPRNYLTKLMTYRQLLDAENSVSHLEDFVTACLACWEKKVPFGIYNLTNPGTITTREVVALLKQHLTPDKEYSFFTDEAEFMQVAAKTPRSNCAMDTSKSEAAGVAMRPVHDALIDSLKNWQPAD
ncbi:MAG: sugar nucleotide-binding protein [Akkermansiaceae bacterium]|nr:sugar nucleotide-binding protein [Akkermansiaceae bacterium]